MNENLWGFVDPSQLSAEHSDTPESILREQMELLKKNTNGVIVPIDAIYSIEFSENIIKNPFLYVYDFAQVFSLTVPALDHYRKAFLTLYSCSDTLYPVTLSPRSFLEDATATDFSASDCSNESDFLATLKSYLGSPETTKLIRNLYQKAQTVGKLND